MKHALFFLLIGPGILISGSVTKYVESGLTASGIQTHVGTLACPKNYKFGTKIKIDDQIFICEDRTADWVQDRNGPTFDIYSVGSREEALTFGKRFKQVLIIK